MRGTNSYAFVQIYVCMFVCVRVCMYSCVSIQEIHFCMIDHIINVITAIDCLSFARIRSKNFSIRIKSVRVCFKCTCLLH